jgi:hypothetical protein
MSDTTDRAVLRGIVDGFLRGWSDGQWAIVPIAADARLVSNQHADAVGRDAIARALGSDTDGGRQLALRVSNRYVGARGDIAAASVYVAGMLQTVSSQALFGSTVAMTFERIEGVWALSTVRIFVNWQQGDVLTLAHWRAVPTNNGWQLGDPPPVLVSELDSPWAVLGESTMEESLEEGVSALYSKYSWAIDQGDIALLADCFTADAAGGFAPMGTMQGRHAIIGQLKSFRRQWPWMQHFADVVRIEPESTTSVRMIVARIIPDRPVDTRGRPVYGAHYQIRARYEADGRWRIAWTDYRPGWFTREAPPAFDLDRTDA